MFEHIDSILSEYAGFSYLAVAINDDYIAVYVCTNGNT